MIDFVIFCVFELILFVSILIGNLIVIYVMSREKMLQRKSNIYILSLAVADLMIGLVGIPMMFPMSVIRNKVLQYSNMNFSQNFDYRPHDYNLCKFSTCVTCSLCITYFNCWIAVAVDRYHAICRPISYRISTGTFSTKCILVLCWFSSISWLV